MSGPKGLSIKEPRHLRSKGLWWPVLYHVRCLTGVQRINPGKRSQERFGHVGISSISMSHPHLCRKSCAGIPGSLD